MYGIVTNVTHISISKGYLKGHTWVGWFLCISGLACESRFVKLSPSQLLLGVNLTHPRLGVQGESTGGLFLSRLESEQELHR